MNSHVKRNARQATTLDKVQLCAPSPIVAFLSMRLIILTNLLLLFGFLRGCEAKFDPKFRMEKINFIWSKAVVHIKNPEMIAKFQKELANFDILYLTIKQDAEHHKKTKNTNEIDRKLEAMLKRYDLEETIEAFKMKYKHDEKKLESQRAPSNDKLDENFTDNRVVELWNSIKNAPDFTNEELSVIHQQLVRQDNRCQDYKELLAHHKQTGDNHINPHDEQKETAAKVKQLNQKIEEAFEEIRKQISEIQENPFKNSKVRQLWDKARRSTRLIPNELDVIKTELRHLDRHWDKVEYHADHLAAHEDHMKSMGHDENDEDSQKLHEQHEKLQRKLKKLEAYLEEKITKHSEL